MAAIETSHEYDVEFPDGTIEYGEVLEEEALLTHPNELRIAGGDSGARPFPIGTMIESSANGGVTWDLEFTIRAFKLSSKEKAAATEAEARLRAETEEEAQAAARHPRRPPVEIRNGRPRLPGKGAQ